MSWMMVMSPSLRYEYKNIRIKLNMVYFTSSINNQINIAGQKKSLQQGK
jgi:hypothetical protein